MNGPVNRGDSKTLSKDASASRGDGTAIIGFAYDFCESTADSAASIAAARDSRAAFS